MRKNVSNVPARGTAAPGPETFVEIPQAELERVEGGTGGQMDPLGYALTANGDTGPTLDPSGSK